ncbi:hypothetical protein ACQKOE_07120 [Novosphingobium sp. NPDC080210]
MIKPLIERIKDALLLYGFAVIAFWPEIFIVLAAVFFAGVVTAMGGAL